MAKLDNKRKVVLVVMGVSIVLFMFVSRPKPTQAPEQALPAPTVEAPAVQQVEKAAEAALAAEPTQNVVEEEPSTEQAAPVPVIDLPKEETAKPFKKFIVYQDDIISNHYDLSGYMPTGKCIRTNDFWKDNCKEGQRCLQITYDVECSKQEQNWAGAYWLEPANNWGNQKGGYVLTGAKKLVFWAKGEKGGEVIESFKVGGITGPTHQFPDSDTATLGPITLTKDWQQYTIDLQGKDLSYIVGGFAWVANTHDNAQPITFYIDSVYYE